MGGQAGGLWIRTKIAHIFPQSPLSACLRLSHSPYLPSFPNSLLQFRRGALGLFISSATTSLSSATSHPLINHLWLSAWLAVCLPNSICVKERVWPCWSVGVARNAGWWISRWCSVSARHQFQGHTHNEGKDAVTLKRAQQQWLTWPSSSRQISKGETTPRLTSEFIQTGMSTCSELTANKNVSLGWRLSSSCAQGGQRSSTCLVWRARRTAFPVVP